MVQCYLRKLDCLQKLDCSLRLYSTFNPLFVFRSSQDSTLRQRNVVPQPPAACREQLDGCMGVQDLTPGALTRPPPPQQHESEANEEPKSAETADHPQESSAVPGAWSPLLTNVCLCTALAVSAYVCYRAYFHWCLFFRHLFSSPGLSSDVAKGSMLASQPAVTLPVTGFFRLQHIQVHSFNLMQCGWGWGVFAGCQVLLLPTETFSEYVILDTQGLGVSGVPSQICMLALTQDVPGLREMCRVSVSSPAIWMCHFHYNLPNEACMCSSISSLVCYAFHTKHQIPDPDFWPACLKICQYERHFFIILLFCVVGLILTQHKGYVCETKMKAALDKRHWLQEACSWMYICTCGSYWSFLLMLEFSLLSGKYRFVKCDIDRLRSTGHRFSLRRLSLVAQWWRIMLQTTKWGRDRVKCLDIV